MTTTIDQANEEAFLELSQTLSLEPRPLGFVGAGSSARVGYPTWNQFLEKLEKEIRRFSPGMEQELGSLAGESDLLWRAQEYRRLLGQDNYHAVIREQFGPEDGRFDKFHQELVSLPFSHILTTNYDNVLPSAHFAAHSKPAHIIVWKNASDVKEFTEQLTNDQYSRRYVFLHGRFNDPDSIILTEEDYRRNYVADSAFIMRLYPVLASQRIVFIGFSLSDFDLLAVFRQLKAYLGPGRPRHFALLPQKSTDNIASSRRKLIEKYGIQPIYYPWSVDHHELSRLIGRLAENVSPLKMTAYSLPRSECEILSHRLGLSPEARRLLLEKPYLWEFSLFSQVLSDEVWNLRDLKKDLELGACVGDFENISFSELTRRAQIDMKVLANNIQVLEKILVTELSTALGPPGVPANLEAVVYTARKVADIYGRLLRFGIRWHRTLVDNRELRVVTLMSRMTGNIIAEIYDFSERIRVEIAEKISKGEPVDGSTVTIQMRLHISIPDDVTNELIREIHTLSNELMSE